MTYASKTTFCLSNLKILRPKVTKNIKNFRKKFCEFPHRAFQWFAQAKIRNGGLVLGSSQFLLLPQLPQKMKLASKVVKNDSSHQAWLNKWHTLYVCQKLNWIDRKKPYQNSKLHQIKYFRLLWWKDKGFWCSDDVLPKMSI